jgi:hypothetical protein
MSDAILASPDQSQRYTKKTNSREENKNKAYGGSLSGQDAGATNPSARKNSRTWQLGCGR